MVVGLAPVLLLAGCASEADRAEERYQIVKQSGSSDQRCKAAREVADAHLRARDAERYKTWNLYAKIDCQAAELDAAADRVFRGL